jgi:hypothetical protein
MVYMGCENDDMKQKATINIFCFLFILTQATLSAVSGRGLATPITRVTLEYSNTATKVRLLQTIKFHLDPYLKPLSHSLSTGSTQFDIETQ